MRSYKTAVVANWESYLKNLKVNATVARLTEPHMAGGCLLTQDIEWPVDKHGHPLLHLLTMPAEWVELGAQGWISLFSPYYREDTFLHWEELTAERENCSVVIYHDNDGGERNEYKEFASSPCKVLIENDIECDSSNNFSSRVCGVVSWLQDEESVAGAECRIMLNGDDFDISFPDDVGIFSGGVVYVFLNEGFSEKSRPSVQGVMTFQFT